MRAALATSPNHYGIPTTMICPQGMVEKIMTSLVFTQASHGLTFVTDNQEQKN